VDGPLASINQVLLLGQILNHFVDVGTGDGKSIPEGIKALDIGGLVFSYQMIPSLFITTEDALQDVYCISQLLVCSDRIDEGGNPVAIDCNWFTNTSPVNVASASEVQDEDQRFPTRVHWRCAHLIDQTFMPITVETGGVTHISQYPVAMAQGRFNKRLRLRLDDEHCLSFHFHVATDNQFPASGRQLAVRCMISGSIYYRWVF